MTEYSLAGPRRLTFVTNPDDCNLSCGFCREHSPLAPPRPSPPRRLTLRLVERILAERASSPLREVLPSTFGEPLIWPDMEGLVALCLAKGLSLNVTTNGTWPRLGPIAWARLLAPSARDVKLSWNAASPAVAARVMGGLDLERAILDLRAFLAVRDAMRGEGLRTCTVSFQVTAQEANVKELPAIVETAARLGVDRVKVNQLQVRFPELESEDLRRDPGSRERWSQAVRGMRAAAADCARHLAGPIVLENVAPWPDSLDELEFGPCPFLGQEGWVKVDGRFAPCPIAVTDSSFPVDLGSLEQRTIGEIWSSEDYRTLVQKHQTAAPCRGCSMRRPGGA